MRSAPCGSAEVLGERRGRGAGAEAHDPRREFCVGRVDPVAGKFEEGEHGHEGEAFVAVDERLGLGDAVGENGGLEENVRVLVLGVGKRAAERSFERGLIPKVCGGLRCRPVDDRRVELERVV